jgi:transcriptional regulator with XRE-family HTH domain
MNRFADRLRVALDRSGITQAELATAIGMTQQGVGYLCKRGKGSKHAHQIARVLGVKADWLADGVGPMCGDGDMPVIALLPPPDSYVRGPDSRYAGIAPDLRDLLHQYEQLTPTQRAECLQRMREQAEANNEVLRHLGGRTDR